MATYTYDWNDYKVNNKWGIRFVELAEFVSKWSKDPSTKLGAVITRGIQIISTGFNGFPRNIRDSEELLNDREQKYPRILHAEVNAILFAQQSIRSCNLYVWPFLPCARCAVQIIQSGIQQVVAPYSDNPRWNEDFALTRELFDEADVVCIELRKEGHYVE